MIVAALSWYDEPELSLAAAVASLAGVADALVAIDGPYAHFPGAADRPASDETQYAAIYEAATRAGVAPHIHMPRAAPWEGGEVEKRAALLAAASELARTDAGDDGWVFVIDGDERVARRQPGWREKLAETELHVANCEFREADHTEKARRFFRAFADLRTEGTHYRYVGGGHVLWGNTRNEDGLDALDLSDEFAMIHLPLRGEDRQERRRAYYRARNRLGIERPPCAECGERGAEFYVPHDLKAKPGGMIDAGWLPVCPQCEPAARKRVVAQGVALRLGPEALRMIARRRADL